MPSNTEIRRAFYTQVAEFCAENSLTIFMSGDSKNTDGLQFWVELLPIPNDYDPFLSDARDIKRGLFQITFCGRKGPSSDGELLALAEIAIAEWPKLSLIVGTVRVTKTPYIMTIIERDSYNALPLTIEYHQ